MRTGLVRLLLAITGVLSATPLSAQATDEQLQAAISEGLKFPTRARYLEKGTKAGRCGWAGTFSMDGIKKEVRFFTDFDIVAASAAAANGEMRRFTLEEARKLPLYDVLFANVWMKAQGAFPVRRLQSKYVEGGLHMVLQVGDSLIQPLSKADIQTEGESAQFGTLYQWYDLGGYSLLTGTPLGYVAQVFQQEFVFPMSAAELPTALQVWVIDGDGNRKMLECELSKLRRLWSTRPQ